MNRAMNEKVTLQAVSDIFSRQFGVPKKTADTFGKAFFDTIVDALNDDGQVKIKGFGTFKIVEVGSRESVNVANGERIVIDGYRKVTFTPDEFEIKQGDTMSETITPIAAVSAGLPSEAQTSPEVRISSDEAVVSSAQPESEGALDKAVVMPSDVQTNLPTSESEDVSTQSTPTAPIASPILSVTDGAMQEVESAVINETTILEAVEVQADEFSGIDMLISTPESIEEVQKNYEEAKVRAEQAIEEAKLANIEYRRLEALLERLSAHVLPEEAGKADQSNDSGEIAKAAVAASVAAEASELSVPLSVQSEEVASRQESTDEAALAAQPEAPRIEVESSGVELSNSSESTNEQPTAEYSSNEELTKEQLSSELPSGSTAKRKIASLSSIKPEDDEDDDEYEDDKVGRHAKLWIIIPLVGLLLAAIAIFAYRYVKYDSPFDEDVQFDNVELTETASDTGDDSSALVAGDDSSKSAVSDIAEPASETKATADLKDSDKTEDKSQQKTHADKTEKVKTPKTHIILKGESLTRISQKYYDTKDSVNAIIRLNNFPDPNNVPIGSEIKLP